MFGRKKRPAVRKNYNETSQSERGWDESHTIGLRAVGTNEGAPLIYAVSQNQISLVWRGKERYQNAVQAVVAAEAHIETAFTRILEDTPERKLDFSVLDK